MSQWVVWLKSEIRVWVLWNTVVKRVLSIRHDGYLVCPWINGSVPSDSYSMVTWMVGSIEFRCWWNCWIWLWERAVRVSSAYLFRNGTGLRRWQVFCPCVSSRKGLGFVGGKCSLHAPLFPLPNWQWWLKQVIPVLYQRFAGKPPPCSSSKWHQGRSSWGPPPHLVVMKCAPWVKCLPQVSDHRLPLLQDQLAPWWTMRLHQRTPVLYQGGEIDRQ